MSDKSHPVWFILGILAVGCLGLGYCSLAFQNGVDLFKDGGLIAIVGGLSAAIGKFLGGPARP